MFEAEEEFLSSQLDNYDAEIKELEKEGNYKASDPDDYYKLLKLARGC